MAASQPPDRLAGLASATISDADPAVAAMMPEIGALWTGARLSGPARTALTPAGENAAVHRAIAAARAGEVLVVQAGGRPDFGLFGEILARACRAAGVCGVVIDGALRDLAAIRALGFPVFARGAHPAACAKRDPGAVDCDIICGGVSVAPGDWIVGDEDGVIVVPRARLDEIAAAAQGVAEREEEILAEVARGRTTCEILGIAPDKNS